MSGTAGSGAPRIRDFWGELPREGRLLLSVVAFQFIGTGLTAPFAVVYLHEVRGFSLTAAGLLIGFGPLLAFLLVGPGGAAIDRLGAKTVLAASLVLLVASDALLMVAGSAATALAAMACYGVGQGLSWPASTTLVSNLIPAEQRQRYFGINFTLINVGYGIGGIVGGFVVDVTRLWTFQLIYVVDALSFVPPLLVLLVGLRHVRLSRRHAEEERPQGSYREVLRGKAVPTLVALNFVTAFVGYAQLNGGLVAFARDVSQVSTAVIGIAFGVNTAIIVLSQLWVLKLIHGHRRTRAIGVLATAWSLSWLALGLSGLVPDSWGSAWLFCVMMGLFGVGETFFQPSMPAITNDLAPEHLRGRYNALGSASFQLPQMIGPPIAGALIGGGLPWVFVALMLIGCAGVAWLAVGRLEPQLTDAENGRVAAA